MKIFDKNGIEQIATVFVSLDKETMDAGDYIVEEFSNQEDLDAYIEEFNNEGIYGGRYDLRCDYIEIQFRNKRVA